MLEALTSVIALLATLVGIIGNTWDKRRKGWRRLTPVGRVVAAIALVSFAVSLYKARQNVLEQREQAQKEQLLRDAAGREVLDAVDTLLEPFELVVDVGPNSTSDSSPESGLVVDRWLYGSVDHLERFGSVDFLTELDGIRALDCPQQFAQARDCNWASFLAMSVRQGERELGSVTERFSSVVDSQTLQAIQAVRSHKMLGIMASAPGNIEMNRELGRDVQDITLGWLLRGPHDPEVHYIPFFKLLEDLVGRANAMRISRVADNA